MFKSPPGRLLPAVAGLVCLFLTSQETGAQETKLITVERSFGTGRTERVPRERMPPLRRPHLNLNSARGIIARRAAGTELAMQVPDLPDTLMVLVLRLEFQIDSDPLTTGDGRFDLRDMETFIAEEGHEIDTAPHNRSFVERHMRALHNYWWACSGGALSVASEVYPLSESGAYLLPEEMAYYGFESPLGDLGAAYEALAADAVAAAESGDDPIDWEKYDAFVLFHAGADWQGDAGGARDTPADLPTAYVMLGEPVPAGSREIVDLTVVPETVSQDGWVGAINGVFAHEFGHQLGLPDLYDTVGMSTAVGLFALMDSGSDTGGTVDDLFVWGVLPASLSPWARLYMGWVTPAEVGPGEEVDLVASTALEGVHDPPPGSKLVLVRAASSQAFLVEFRTDDLDGDPSISLFWEDGVIDGTGRLENGTKVRTYEYDALLPSSGVIIWHLDEGVAAADTDGNGLSNFEDNTLQQDRLHRFLDVEEADGLQELGWVPGYIGSEYDYWLPTPEGPSEFGPLTTPGTESWTGASTGLELEVMQHSSPLARRVRVGSRARLTWWAAPLTDPDPEISIPWMVDLDSDGDHVVVVLDGGGGLHLLDPDGGPAAGPNPVWTAPGPVKAPLTVAGTSLVVAAGTSVYFLSEDGTETGSVDLGYEAVCRPLGYYGPGGARTLVALSYGQVVEVTHAGVEESWIVGGMGYMRKHVSKLFYGSGLYRIAVVGNELYRLNPGTYNSVVCMWRGGTDIVDIVQFRPLSGDTQPAVAVLEESGQITYFDSGGTGRNLRKIGASVVPQPVGEMALAYLEEGRRPVMVVPTVEGLQAAETTGPLASGWPPPVGGRAAVPSPPVNGTPLTFAFGVVAGVSSEAELLFHGPYAELLFGGIRQLPGAPSGTFTIGDRGVGGNFSLLYTDSDSLRSVSLAIPGLDVKNPVWPGPSGGADGRGVPLRFEESVSPAAYSGRLYVYPNPVHDRCTVRAEGLSGELTLHAYTGGGTYVGEVARFVCSSTGVSEAPWDASGLAPGVYFLVAELRTTDSAATLRERRRLTVLVVR